MVQPLTTAQRKHYLGRIEQALLPPADIFDGGNVSAVDRAKATPTGRAAVKELAAAARALNVDRLELTIEVYGAVLKTKRERLQRQHAKLLDREQEKSLRKERRKQESEDGKVRAKKAVWRAGLKKSRNADL